jgi:hypothetical protein
MPNFEAGAQWLGDRLPGEVAKYLEPAGALARPVLPPAHPAADRKPVSG